MIFTSTLSTQCLAETVKHVFFHHKAEIYTTRSKWLVGFVLDLQTYRRYIDSVTGNLDKLENNIQEGLVKIREIPHIDKHDTDLVLSLLDVVRYMKYLHEFNINSFEDATHLGKSFKLTRNKRKARKKRQLPIIGVALSGLFSGISFVETLLLRNEVNELRANQETIRHVVKKSLFIINITRIEVQENRNAINQLMKITTALGAKVQTDDFYIRVFLLPMQRFLYIYSQMTTNVEKIKQILDIETTLVETMKQKISHLTLNRLSPIILPVEDLKEILIAIDDEIPDHLMLPHDPHEKPWYYYTILSSTTIAFDDKMVITVNIPLLDASRAFTVVEAINLPVPFPPSIVTAIYELEFEHFSVSADKKQYTIMTVEDLIRCRQPGLNFCPLTSAEYETSQHEYCVSALYRKNVKEIRKFCKTSVSNMLKLPSTSRQENG